ncbi:hypothetical protein AN960_22585 [Bacillus sp. FJAT-25509]|uniref:hypothetical protein n=1 Tax=Bacillus sp. FJAT-25509 TaxID=1712029 RepID=UPI0006F55F66|nr:hypothetical protein [Bacillus sp. FJAT-25509]KQL32765.1 hypothetical protein AN960_22585 [Bacillus sp. FJAT-25509]
MKNEIKKIECGGEMVIKPCGEKVCKFHIAVSTPQNIFQIILVGLLPPLLKIFVFRWLNWF